MIWKFALGIILLTFISCSGGSGADRIQTEVVDLAPTVTSIPTPMSVPTATPAPTITSVPTATPGPTITSVPTAIPAIPQTEALKTQPTPTLVGGQFDGRYADLTYKFAGSDGISNRIFKPENNNGGAILFLPSCSGVQHFNSSDIKENWVDIFVERGYTVAVTDYNEGRNASDPWNCGKDKHLSHSRLVRDVYIGVQALSNVPGINKDKIFTIGTSLGAQIGASAVDGHYIDESQKTGWAIPSAHVGLYGGCGYTSQQYLETSVNRPVLWLSASDDVEVGEGCSIELFNSIMEKFPKSDFITYDGATHCWDCKQLDGFKKNTHFGVQEYRYDPDVTVQSQNQVLTFIEKFMQ